VVRHCLTAASATTAVQDYNNQQHCHRAIRRCPQSRSMDRCESVDARPRLPCCKDMLFHLRRLRSLCRQLGRDVTARLVSALVLSRLDYCNAILVCVPQTTLSSLQRVLHAAARMILNLRPCDHVTPALLELHWLPIAERIDFKLCLLVHKALVGHAPQYIADLKRQVADLPSRASLRTAPSGDWRYVCATNM